MGYGLTRKSRRPKGTKPQKGGPVERIRKVLVCKVTSRQPQRASPCRGAYLPRPVSHKEPPHAKAPISCVPLAARHLRLQGNLSYRVPSVAKNLRL